MNIEILTLFPEMFGGVLTASVIGRAAERGILDFSVTDIRAHATNKHRKADDAPFGGGAGQLMSAQPIFSALRHIGTDGKRLIYLSPRGRILGKALIEELAEAQRLVLLCGHYEGVDQRVLDHFAFEEISVGDFVLTGGELPAMALIDAVCRVIPGVLGSAASHAEESVYSGLLEYPQYTRPASFEGMGVPDVLTSGNHRQIELWNFEQALRLTAARRPDMLHAFRDARFDKLDKQKKRIFESVFPMVMVSE
jgi:tRNA (guanine37-N1)-methyltransferase